MPKSGISIFGWKNAIDALDYEPIGTVRYIVGTNVEYAIYVEYGTSRMQAQPYLHPAVERTMRNFDTYADRANSTEELVETLALQIEREAKQLVPVKTSNLKGSIEAERIQ